MTVLRVATQAAEVLIAVDPKLRVATAAAETLISASPKMRVPTVAAEILASVENAAPTITYTGWGMHI